MLAMIAGPHSPRRKPQVNAMDRTRFSAPTGDGGLDGGSAGQDRSGCWPEGEQPGAWLGAVGEGVADQHPPARADHPAQLAGAGGQVAEVVDDGRQPGAVAAAIAQRQLLTQATDVGDPGVGACAACLAAHALGGLHGHHVGAEPLGDRGREQPGAGPKVQHRQPGGRWQVGGQRRPPRLQGLQRHGPIAVVDGGELVIVHPGHGRVLPGQQATNAPTGCASVACWDSRPPATWMAVLG
jgi:hypothetical protein